MSKDEIPSLVDSVCGVDKMQWSLISNSKPNVATEDHLQSLGLDIDNGLPKFKLNEPGPTALASSIFQQKNMVNDESEQSFVVLGKTSLESLREDCLASYMKIQQKSTSTDHSSLISTMGPSEIEQNLKKVLDENIKLKETLKENNDAIKQQFNTITIWQKEVMSICDNHKQKFLETKDLISRLKKENNELREKIVKNQSEDVTGFTSSIASNFLNLNLMENDELCEKIIKNQSEDVTGFTSSIASNFLNPNSMDNDELHEKIVKNQSEDVTGFTSSIASNFLNPNSMDNDELHEKITKNQSEDVTGFTSSIASNFLNLNSMENDELREKIIRNQQNSTGFTCTVVSNLLDSLLKNSNCPSKQTNSSFSLSDIKCADDDCIKVQSDQNQIKNEELLKKIDILSEELYKTKINHSKTQEVLQELQKLYVNDIELFSQQLQKANKELETFKQKSDSSSSSELQKFVGKCCEKDIELKYLKEIIVSLEQQIKKFENYNFPLIDLPIESSEETSEDQLLLKENIKFYNVKLEELGKCFASQCHRYLRIQEILKESADIIQVFENAKMLPNSTLSEDKVKTYKNKLCDNRKRLIDEQLQSIDDRQITVKVQKQFQKVLSDYNSVSYQLEILKDENSKLAIMQIKAAEENSEKLAKIEKYLDEEKKILDNEKTGLLEDKLNLQMEKKLVMEEKLNLQMEKKLVTEEKEKIEAEHNSLSTDKQRLIDERSILIEERTSLDRQSKLYEAEEGTLQKEKKSLQKKCEELTNVIDNLKLDLSIANITIQKLQADNYKLTENEETISIYKIQTQMHEKEFQEMRIMQKSLQDQLQSLAMANLQLRTENERLGGRANDQSNSHSNSTNFSNMGYLFCPNCKNGIAANSISAHLHKCYKFQ